MKIQFRSLPFILLISTLISAQGLNELKLTPIVQKTGPSRPGGISAEGYLKHIDLSWNPNRESDIISYNIYRSQPIFKEKDEQRNRSKLTFTKIGTSSSDIPFFTDFVDTTGITYKYEITAVNSQNVESEFSRKVTASTRRMTDDELLTMLQKATFRYFWDYAHPVSGMARERLGSGELVTTGGTGFGLMAIPVGIERGFIKRKEGVERVLKILKFLSAADRFHGAWPHWMSGTTGKVIPFSTYDDGGDLVETAFLVQGLLTLREYFSKNTPDEKDIRSIITNLWETVEWNWYRQFSNSPYLYWHWSPDYDWHINLKITGQNEAMIVYLLAIASPTYRMPASSYKDGWAGNPNYVNGNTFYGYKLYVGPDYGGPLFFTHYSFLGFDPRNKKDAYANYFINNRNQTLINRAYCIANPGNHQGYNENCWGLTASDDPFGYAAHEPTASGDDGTITPSAALSSIVYTPEKSLEAFKYMYKTYGKKIWGVFGFKDAFNLDQNWFADSYLAIDEGPIIDMIENFRSQLLWKNFMANPEIKPMLDSIGFIPDASPQFKSDLKVLKTAGVPGEYQLLQNYPNPFNPSTVISYDLPNDEFVTLRVYDIVGKEIATLVNEDQPAGTYNVFFSVKGGSAFSGNISSLPSGIYFYRLEAGKFVKTRKMILMK